MTRRQLEQIVAWWTPRLGLSTWDLTVEPDDEWDEEDTGNAYALRSNDYEKARLYFHPQRYPAWTRVETHRFVVHELLHLLTRDVEFVLNLLEPLVAGDRYELIKSAHGHHVEGAIDRLAYRFVELVGITESSRP